MVRSSKAAAKQPLFAWTNMGSSSTGGKQIINEGRYFPIWWAFGVEMNPELDHVFALTYVTSQRLLGLASGEKGQTDAWIAGAIHASVWPFSPQAICCYRNWANSDRFKATIY
jgi:hypothetical protein